MNKERPPLGVHSRTKQPNVSIHPRRPRLVDLGIKIPKDLDGAYRAENRLDGRWIDLKAGLHRAVRTKVDEAA